MGWSLMGFLQGVILLGPHNKGSGISFALQPTTLSCPLNVISSIGILGLLVSDCTWMIQPNLYMCLHSNCNWGNGNADYDKNMSNYFGMNIVILMTMVHLEKTAVITPMIIINYVTGAGADPRLLRFFFRFNS